MKSEILQQIKSDFKSLLKDKETLDIIVFGSFAKGKAVPKDIDIAIISKKQLGHSINKYHISILKPEDFFVNPPTIITTLLKEGYSIKYNKPFAEVFRFKPSILFSYTLQSLNNSQKVKIVNILRGKGKNKGLVEEYNGEWLSNSVFIINPESEFLFERFLINQKVNFKKYSILIH